MTQYKEPIIQGIDEKGRALLTKSNVTKADMLRVYEETFNNKQKAALTTCMIGLTSTSAIKRNFKNNLEEFLTLYEVNKIVEDIYAGDREKFYTAIGKTKEDMPSEEQLIINQLKEISRRVVGIEDMSRCEEITQITVEIQKIIEAKQILLAVTSRKAESK